MRRSYYAGFLFLISGGLSGCSSLGLQTIDPIGVQYGTSLSAQIAAAATRQTEYGTKANGLAKRLENDAWFRLGTGTALAGVAIFEGSSYFLRGFGLLGGVNLAVDTTFNPNSQAETYEAGYHAITCMIDKAQVVAASPNSPTLNSFMADPRKTMSITQTGDSQANSRIFEKFTNFLKSKATLLSSPPDAVLANAFTKNLRSLDHSVRTKIRKTLRSPDYTTLRDDLIRRAAEAAKNRDEGQETVAVAAAIMSDFEGSADVGPIKQMVDAAVARKNFDDDLKTCIAGAGL